jgi:hypothetical protein
MTIVNGAKAKIISMIDAGLSVASLGTSSQSPSVLDTALIAEVTSTIESITGAPSNQQLVITYNLNSVTGNGNTYTEYGNKFTNGITTSEVLLNRITFTGVPKNSALEFQVSTIINIV